MNRTLRVRAYFVLALGFCLVCSPTTAQKSVPAKLLLRVMNRHFTVGLRIPSEYLQVFSDGSVECHSIKFGENDEDEVRKGRLSPEELSKLTSALNDVGFRHLSEDYKMKRTVIDSWMEWDITVERTWLHSQNITLAFAGGNSDSRLPDPLSKLACQIQELRRKVYGDNVGYYDAACVGFWY